MTVPSSEEESECFSVFFFHICSLSLTFSVRTLFPFLCKFSALDDCKHEEPYDGRIELL